MKAEELIKNNLLGMQNLPDILKPDGTVQKVVFEEIALTAVNVARIEEKERAYKALEFVLDEWINSSDVELFLSDFKSSLEAI